MELLIGLLLLFLVAYVIIVFTKKIAFSVLGTVPGIIIIIVIIILIMQL